MHYSDTIGSGWVPALLIPNKEKPSWIKSPAGASGAGRLVHGSGRQQRVCGWQVLIHQDCRPPKMKGNQRRLDNPPRIRPALR